MAAINGLTQVFPDAPELGAPLPESWGDQLKVWLAANPQSALSTEPTFLTVERALVEWALSATNNNRAAAADLLKIKRTALQMKMKKFGIAPPAAGRAEYRKINKAHWRRVTK